MKIRILPYMAFAMSVACSVPSPLEQALQMTDENRPELERVIAHYDSIGDSENVTT